MSRASRHRILAAMLSACLLSLLGGCTPLTVLAVLGGCKDGGSNGSSGGVTGSVTTGEVRDGMTIAQTKAWFNGSDGPDNVCQAYPDGQCTWWACMRGHKIGLDVGSYWGNGGDWAASATAAGWKTTRTDPVAGSIVSYPPGVADADTLYGHVAVVEAVDRTAGTVTISEMNGRGGLGIVNHRTHRINVGAVYILPNGSVSTNGSAGTDSTSSGSESSDSSSSSDFVLLFGSGGGGMDVLQFRLGLHGRGGGLRRRRHPRHAGTGPGHRPEDDRLVQGLGRRRL